MKQTRKVNIKCGYCKSTRKTFIDDNLPKEVVSMASNYCPRCEKDNIGSCWEEYYLNKNNEEVTFVYDSNYKIIGVEKTKS